MVTSNEDSEFNKMRDMIHEGFKRFSSKGYNEDKELINELSGIVFLHVNEFNDTSVINYNAFAEIYERAMYSIYTICYIKYYTINLLSRDALKDTAMNLIHISLNMILNGNRRDYKIQEARAKATTIIGSK